MATLNDVLTLKPQVATLPMSAVKLHLNGETPLAEINGLNAIISREARKDLIEMAGLDLKSVETLNRNYGTGGAQKILHDAFRALGNRQVSLAFDGPRITRILQPDARASALKPAQIVQIAEFFQDKGLSIHGVQVSPDGTSASIQIVDRGREHETPLLPNEAMHSGYDLNWDAFGGTTVNEFLVRLVCTNGLTAKSVRSLNALTAGMDPAAIYKALFNENAQKFIAQHWARIAKLQETPMSVAEFRQIQGLLIPFNKDEDVFRAHFGEPNIRDMKWMGEYDRRSLFLDQMTIAQQRNAPTPVRWWDAINAVTWFGSHENKSGVSEWDAGTLMESAGKLMTKTPDAEAWLVGAPVFN